MKKKITIRKLNNLQIDSPFTIVAKLYFAFKSLYFVNDKIWAGCSKLGHSPSPILDRKRLVEKRK